MTTTQEDMLKGDFDLCVIQYTHLDGEKQRYDWRIGRTRNCSWSHFIEPIKQACSLIFSILCGCTDHNSSHSACFSIVYRTFSIHVNLGVSVCLQKHCLLLISLCSLFSDPWCARADPLYDHPVLCSGGGQSGGQRTQNVSLIKTLVLMKS